MTMFNQPNYYTQPPLPSSAPVRAGWWRLGLSWIVFLLPIPILSSVAGWALNLAALVVAIIVIVKGKVGSGIAQLALMLVVSPVVYVLSLLVYPIVMAILGHATTQPH
jgi:hypothetical protein